jgi:hypothetical protein
VADRHAYGDRHLICTATPGRPDGVMRSVVVLLLCWGPPWGVAVRHADPRPPIRWGPRQGLPDPRELPTDAAKARRHPPDDA